MHLDLERPTGQVTRRTDGILWLEHPVSCYSFEDGLYNISAVFYPVLSH